MHMQIFSLFATFWPLLHTGYSELCWSNASIDAVLKEDFYLNASSVPLLFVPHLCMYDIWNMHVVHMVPARYS